eukprot:GHVP01028556.1.p1 GENE.GHVP01028556.1~~GHVP01028556.1.p1  ORF type:complete len:133 (+),score=18.87 GHVP01028556.1:15-413(+)
MDSVYGHSVVISALRDTLQELTNELFVTKESARKIHKEACQAVYRELRNSSTTEIRLDGVVAYYKFRKNVWVFVVKEGDMKIYRGGTQPPRRIRLEKPLKIVSADKVLWKRQSLMNQKREREIQNFREAKNI